MRRRGGGGDPAHFALLFTGGGGGHSVLLTAYATYMIVGAVLVRRRDLALEPPALAAVVGLHSVTAVSGGGHAKTAVHTRMCD
jgi:hypothetical protein